MKTITTIIATLLALFTFNNSAFAGTTADDSPTAYNVTMTPVVQSTDLLPLQAASANSIIAMFTIVSIPTEDQGTLSIDMNGHMVPVGEGMMLTADLAGELYFTPNPSFNGTVVFTYTASDESGFSSNIASYTIPVINAQQGSLPVTLLQFSATPENKIVMLNWQTTHEANSSYFEIQRSMDGNNFETIATETAKGNHEGINMYNSRDDLFFYTATVVHYRLKMVDINGRATFSAVQVINLNKTAQGSIKVWPLPFSSTLHAGYTAAANETISIKLVSVNGSVISVSNQAVTTGFNTIRIYQAQSIASGTYVLIISNGKKTEAVKVVKQ